jgi:hypothetical protein
MNEEHHSSSVIMAIARLPLSETSSTCANHPRNSKQLPRKNTSRKRQPPSRESTTYARNNCSTTTEASDAMRCRPARTAAVGRRLRRRRRSWFFCTRLLRRRGANGSGKQRADVIVSGASASFDPADSSAIATRGDGAGSNDSQRQPRPSWSKSRRCLHARRLVQRRPCAWCLKILSTSASGISSPSNTRPVQTGSAPNLLVRSCESCQQQSTRAYAHALCADLAVNHVAHISRVVRRMTKQML